MELSNFQEIRSSLRQLYLADPRPWLVGFSGGKDSTMVASLIFETVTSIPREQRTKPIAFLCTDTRVEISAIVECPPRYAPFGTLAIPDVCPPQTVLPRDRDQFIFTENNVQ